MRNVIFCVSLALTCLCATPAIAGDVHNVVHNSEDTLTWHNADHVLTLHSEGNGGIHVTQAEPEGVWGLQQGDEILSIDGNPVMHVGELLHRLRMRKPAAVTLRVRRDGVERELVVNGTDYAQALGPKPPTPPKTPAQSSTPHQPPTPPTPPTAATSSFGG